MGKPFVVTVRQTWEGELMTSLHVPNQSDAAALMLYPLNFDHDTQPRPLHSRQYVETYGTSLFLALAKNPEIAEVLNKISKRPPVAPPTLLFDIQSPRGEGIRWETVCAANLFFAIDAACLILRVVNAAASPSSSVRVFQWPLRMAAFLSAAGVTARKELKAIEETVAGSRANGLELALTLYLGEQALLDDVNARIADGTLLGVEVKPMPASALEIEKELKDHPAQFLHFFCHGLSEAGLQYLEFGTISDFDRGLKKGSVILSVARLVRLETLSRAWIVTLNCCEGASSTEQLYSMAYRIVADGGAPSAIGMNEPIFSVDAPTFSRTFYAELFRIVTDKLTVTQLGQPVEIDFSPAIVTVRKALHDQYRSHPPDAFGRWSVPVLYATRENLWVQHVNAQMEAVQRKIDLVARLLRTLPPETPEEARKEILSLLDKDPAAPKALHPNAFGLFV